MNVHLSEQMRHLDSHQKEFEKLVTEALATDQPLVPLRYFLLMIAIGIISCIESGLSSTERSGINIASQVLQSEIPGLLY